MSKSCEPLCWYDIVLNQTTKNDLYQLRHSSENLVLKGLSCDKFFDFSEYCEWEEPTYGLEVTAYFSNDTISILSLSWNEENIVTQDIFDRLTYPSYYAYSWPGRHGERILHIALFYENGLIIDAYQNFEIIQTCKDLYDFQVTDLYYVSQSFLDHKEQTNSNNELFTYFKKRLMYDKKVIWSEEEYTQLKTSACNH